jgi:hypothetical protein
MKKHDVLDLKAAQKSLDLIMTGNPVIEEFKKNLAAEIKKRDAPKFVKATDAEIALIPSSDIFTRLLGPKDEYYYPGMYGLFQKSTSRLLRRHTDTGYFPH